MNLACSYNHHFYTGRLFPNKEVRFLELGFRAYNKIFFQDNPPHYLKDLNLSLHISRSPITESLQNQTTFIEEKLSDIRSDDRVVSIGFHLCGERDTNIGQFGFSSHYSGTPERERNAIGFIRRVQESTQKEVWLENANFYSSSAPELIANWKSFNRIVEQSKAKSIIDISHLIIDCENNGIESSMAIGFIDWSAVTELHLSGIIEGKDGTLHDGHGSKVHPRVWEILEQLLKAKLIDTSIIYNIEHSDENWAEQKDAYNDDFHKLKVLLNKSFIEGEKSKQATLYATGYLKKLLIQEVENIEEIACFFNMTRAELLEEWTTYISQSQKRLALSLDDMDSVIASKSIHFIDSFSNFIEAKQL